MRQIRILRLALIAGLAMGPAFASERGDVNLSPNAPTPAHMLQHASAALNAGNIPAATSDIELVEHQLLVSSSAEDAPLSVSGTPMLEALPLLDEARQALAQGDTGAAHVAIDKAQALL